MTRKPERQPRRLALRLNILVLRFARNWLKVVLVILSIYVALPFIAPTLMHLGATGPARVIYTVYSPFCHQFGFRSFYLFGEQPVYPRAAAESRWIPYEDMTRDLPQFERFTPADEFTLGWSLAHKNFLGNETMGYKVALCGRDIFIYMAILAGGYIYAISFVRRRLRPVPLLLYVFLGLGPIGLDGFSQLLGYPPFNLWPPRETLPVFRVLTGAIFGFMSAWLAFPYLELSMQDARRDIEAKLWRAGVKEL